jgi:hypothetical protein
MPSFPVRSFNAFRHVEDFEIVHAQPFEKPIKDGRVDFRKLSDLRSSGTKTVIERLVEAVACRTETRIHSELVLWLEAVRRQSCVSAPCQHGFYTSLFVIVPGVQFAVLCR